MRRIVIAFCALLVVLTGATVAVAANAGTVADELDFRGYYVEPGADGDVNALENLVVEAREDGKAWYFVSLASEQAGGNDAFAEEIQLVIGEPGTILVVSPREIGAVSSEFDDTAVNRAVDASFDDFNDSFEEGSATFVDSLKGRSSDGGGGSALAGLLVILIPIAGIVGLGFLFSRFARKKSDARTGESIDDARAEIKAQLDAVASGIVDHSERVELSENEQIVEYYRAASATYEEANANLEEADSLAELAEIAGEVDRARWQLDAVAALLEGKEVPPEPTPDKPAACFFDPRHEPGTEAATIKTAAGQKEVRVCPMDAEKLRRGERPEPRTIKVGDRRVPAGMAPKSHGGLGMGGLGPFEMVLGGLAKAALSFDWGSLQARPRRRSPGGTFGPDILPGGGVFGPRSGPVGRSGRSRSSGRRSRRRSSPTIGRARRRR